MDILAHNDLFDYSISGNDDFENVYLQCKFLRAYLAMIYEAWNSLVALYNEHKENNKDKAALRTLRYARVILSALSVYTGTLVKWLLKCRMDQTVDSASRELQTYFNWLVDKTNEALSPHVDSDLVLKWVDFDGAVRREREAYAANYPASSGRGGAGNERWPFRAVTPTKLRIAAMERTTRGDLSCMNTEHRNAYASAPLLGAERR